jgi:hypothetical protein
VEIRGQGPDRGLAVADLDGDGILDVAVVDVSRRVVGIYLGDGSGRFSLAAELPTTPFADGLVASDLDGDGRVDLAILVAWTGVPGGDGVLVLRNQGGLRFVADPLVPVCDRPLRMVAADLDGDGRPDLSLTCFGYGPGLAAVLLSRGAGFEVATYPAGTEPAAIAVADLDGDGARDLIIGNWGAGAFTILFGRGDGTFDRSLAIPSCDYVWDVAVADLDGDGWLDVAESCYSSGLEPGFVEIHRGLGAGALAPAYQVPIVGRLSSLAARDLDGDGIPDLLVTTRDDGGTLFLRGAGDGTFLPPVGHPAGYVSAGPVIADLDGDGRRDLVSWVADGFAGQGKIVIQPQACLP